MLESPIILALFGGLITWTFTSLGSALVFVFFSEIKPKVLACMYGFAAGVMTAASFWSLLAPSIELSSNMDIPNWIVPVFGFLIGSFFIWILDKVIPHIHMVNGHEEKEGPKVRLSKSVLLFLAITLHNIPEGLAVGVAFGILKENNNATTLTSAISIAIGIGLQNLPEGAAVSLPLRKEGYSRKKSFFYGQLSAIVEPIFSVIGAILVMTTEKILPFALSFAAGAMILVAVHELIPECQKNQEKGNYIGTTGIIFGFAVMMLLDIALG